MTAALRDWLLGLTGVALALAAAESLAPEGRVRRVCRLAGGLALLLVALNPLTALKGFDLAQTLEDYAADVQAGSGRLEEGREALYESIIAQSTAAYIVDKAEELGVLCQAEVELERTEEGACVPWSVTLRGHWTQEGREAVGRVLEEELGIPAQRQTYEETEP